MMQVQQQHVGRGLDFDSGGKGKRKDQKKRPVTASPPSATFLDVCHMEKWKEMPGDGYEEFIALLLCECYVREIYLDGSSLLTGLDWDGRACIVAS